MATTQVVNGAVVPPVQVGDLAAKLNSLKDKLPSAQAATPVPVKAIEVAPKPEVAEPSDFEKLKAEMERLTAENAALRAAKPAGRISLKRSEKGALSAYGLGRFPVTLYREQWERLLNESDAIRAFIKAHASELKLKGE